jgi:hypothetical protein
MSMIEKNSHNGDSLTLDIKELWNIDGFDAIIENPPYNEKNKNGKTVQGKNKLYSNFMKCGLERLVDKGHLVYVTPLGWITGNMNIYSEVIKYNMEYINFNKVKETYFPNIGDSLCYYSICKEANKFNTKLIDYNGDVLFVPFKGKKESKLFPVIFTKENINLMNKILMVNSKYNGLVYVKEWREGTRGDMTIEKSDEFCYEIKEFKTSTKSKYTNINNESRYGKKFIIYEICGSFDCKYYDTPVYAGSHTFYLDILDDKYGFLLEKWFQTELFRKIYDITKSSQYIKSGLVKHIKIPTEDKVYEIDINNIEEYQNKFYGIE